ncbi:PREDICTED: uncharacterized protein LOC105973170 [Erythranthe guttata]|uniref:uncharacterized protein LOC105973170 n=1 Tax=Erythranthe guttata TaxID=4155 RepID=UPI00064D9855|nr:PREDICTED: uncharacterized protein LOC105973170 [Erythranthe guttata]|eukprot:XP_012853645.1 PREDICTED: uncharacterized protein LOC105973170 [Erythranthe guttata]
MHALRGKYAFQLMRKQSLWARVILSKIRGNLYGSLPILSSKMLKAIWPHIQVLRGHSRWIIGEGQIDFWRDIWLGTPIDSDFTGELFSVSAGMHMRSHLAVLVSSEIWERIKLIHIQPEHKDELIFTKTPSGRFSVSKYWDLRRQRGVVVDWADIVWNKYTPFRLNAFMWRFQWNALHLDDKIQTRGIPLVSRCLCCVSPQTENIIHLFFRSEVAIAVWRYFSHKLHKPYIGLIGFQLLRNWLHDIRRDTQLGIGTLSLFFYIVYEIWKDRCMALFLDIPMNASRIIKKMEFQFTILSGISLPRTPGNPREQQVLATFHIPLRQVSSRKGSWVVWHKPVSNCLKINTDAAHRPTTLAGAGVVRDNNGEYLTGFTLYFEHTWSVLYIEIFTILHAIVFAGEYGFSQVVVESDSEIGVKMIKGLTDPHWEVIQLVRRCRRAIFPGLRIQSCFREQNRVADALAKDALISKKTENGVTSESLPYHIKKLLFEDRIGLWNFRR